MIIRKQAPKALGLNEPLRHADHKRPVSRRDFIAQGFLTGGATVVAPAMLGMALNPRSATAATLSPDVWRNNICNIQLGAGKIPFICFDLAGGANIAGSNVLVGNQNGQLDVLSTAGYSKLGLPGNMLPNSSTGTFIDTQFGLAFHSDSAFLRGMLMTTSTATRAMVSGAVIPARSENDTGNNPHNPMYGIARAGARGQLLSLIGSQSSDSGGNSMAPAMLMDPTVRPTKVDRPSDARGLVDTGDLAKMFPDPADTVKVMESIERISRDKLAAVDTKLPTDAALKQQVDCGYVKAASLADFSADTVDPTKDTNISAIFQPLGGISADGEFGKTAAVMKLVVDGMAGAGTITMGGFDYHTGDRATGEARDFRAGVCMGACLEYAARTGKPLMLYVFSDGSLNSNGMIDNSTGGRGKGQWTGDNQSTAASFFLVLRPAGRPQIYTGGGSIPAARRQQLGYFRASGDVETSGSPGANSVVSLVDMVLLNYMALHGEQNLFGDASHFPNSVLNSAGIDNWIAFNPIVNHTVSNPL
ncbi:MAG: hypothetical protein AB7T07_09650 [Steroidobacteraceae bacterium]